MLGTDQSQGTKSEEQDNLSLDTSPLSLKFDCERCGRCCRKVGTVPIAKDMALPNGVCKYLNEETNLCRIYETRPLICNVDAYYDRYMKDVMTREEFHARNKEICRSFRK